MNVFLWILRGVVAAMFLMAGVRKSTQPKEKLAPKMAWVEDFPAGTVRLIGVIELLGVVPVLTPLAATGLAIVMALAMNTHRRGLVGGRVLRAPRRRAALRRSLRPA